MKRFLLVFLIISVVLAINFKAGILAQFSVENFAIAMAVALVVSAIISDEHPGFIAMVVVVGLAANVPRATALSMGYDRDVMIALLVALVFLPMVSRQF